MSIDNNWIVLNGQAINQIRKAANQTLTQGEMMLRANCPRKWFYRYVRRLTRRGFIDYNLVYGALMHALLEELYETGLYSFPPSDEPLKISKQMIAQITEGIVLTPKDQTELELIKAKVQIHFDAYRMYYHRLDAKMIVMGVEKIYQYVFGGLKLAGKLDLVAKPNRHDGVCVWDFKTAGMLDASMLDAWTFKFQFLFYCWLYWKVTGTKPIAIMINGLVKPQLRPRMIDRKTKQLESVSQYLFRLKGEMAANREKYFYRQRIPLGVGALERFEKEILLPHVDAFNLLGKEIAFPAAVNALGMQMNTNHCHVYGSTCEYLSLCKDGLMALREFDVREHKHQELTNG